MAVQYLPIFLCMVLRGAVVVRSERHRTDAERSDRLPRADLGAGLVENPPISAFRDVCVYRCEVVSRFVTEPFSHKRRTRMAHAGEDRQGLLVRCAGGRVVALRALDVTETGQRIGLAGPVTEVGE